MLYLPSGGLPPKKSKTGIARGRAASGFWLRARPAQRNTRSTAQGLWRQVFASAKRLWLSLGTGGVNNIPTNGVDPQSAWLSQSLFYFGIVMPGPIIDGVQGEGTLIGCATPEAYFVMVQANAASQGQSEMPTPIVTTIAVTSGTSSATNTVSPTTLEAIPVPAGTTNGDTGVEFTQSSPLGATFVISLSVAVSAYATPAEDTQNGNQYWNFQPNQLALTQDGNAVTLATTLSPPPVVGAVYNTDWTISTLPSGVTATIGEMAFPATLTPPEMALFSVVFTADGTAAPGSYSITLTAVANSITNYCYLTLVVYSTAENTYTLSCGSLPGGAVAQFSQSVVTPSYEPTGPALTAKAALTVTIANATATGTYTFSIEVTGPNSPVSVDQQLIVTTVTLTPAYPGPIWASPTDLSCTTTYDLSYNVIDFFVEYTWAQEWDTPASPWVWDGTGWAGSIGNSQSVFWAITASPAYTSSYSVPPVSSWAALGVLTSLSGALDGLLAPWEAVFGDLPDSGEITFQIQPLDPTTNTVGPALSATASWAQGTLRGMDLTNWTGPIWSLVGPQDWDSTVTYEPGDVVVTITGTWTSIQTSTNVTPASGAYWYAGDVNVWSSTWTWSPNEIVFYAGNLYFSLQQSLNQTPGNTAYWQPTPYSAWDSGTEYFTGGMASYAGTDWIALQDSTGVTPAWGPYWTVGTKTVTFGPTAPGVYLTKLQVKGSNGYGGTITFKVSALKNGTSFQYGPTSPLPAGVSYAFDPPTLSIPPGSSDVLSTILTITAISGCQSWDAEIKISGSDGISSSSVKTIMVVDGDVTPTLPTTGLNFNTSTTNETISIPGTATITYTLYNTTGEAIDATLIAGYPNIDLVFAFSPVGVTVPGTTTYGPAPSNATPSGTNLVFNDPFGIPAGTAVGGYIATSGYEPSVYNTVYNQISANDGSTITVVVGSTFPAQTTEGTLTVVAPGSAATTLTITVPATVYNPGTRLDVEAAAGIYSCFTYVNITL